MREAPSIIKGFLEPLPAALIARSGSMPRDVTGARFGQPVPIPAGATLYASVNGPSMTSPVYSDYLAGLSFVGGRSSQRSRTRRIDREFKEFGVPYDTIPEDYPRGRALRFTAPSGHTQPAHARVAHLGDRVPALRLARAALAGHETEIGLELMRVAEAVGIVDGGEEGGGGDGADAGDGTQARHAGILDGEVFDRGVGVRELPKDEEPQDPLQRDLPVGKDARGRRDAAPSRRVTGSRSV